MNYRIKIIEIIVNNNGIFAKTIPYKDDKSKIKINEKFNLNNELHLICNLIQSIKRSISLEKIDVIGQLEIETTKNFDLNSESIDRMIF